MLFSIAKNTKLSQSNICIYQTHTGILKLSYDKFTQFSTMNFIKLLFINHLMYPESAFYAAVKCKSFTFQ